MGLEVGLVLPGSSRFGCKARRVQVRRHFATFFADHDDDDLNCTHIQRYYKHCRLAGAVCPHRPGIGQARASDGRGLIQRRRPSEPSTTLHRLQGADVDKRFLG